MIFTFGHAPADTLHFEMENTDIFCFFRPLNTITIPEASWVLAIGSSLKLKKNVLILERALLTGPEINSTQRCQIHQDYMWLAPRSLSVLLEASQKLPGTYNSVKSALEKFK